MHGGKALGFKIISGLAATALALGLSSCDNQSLSNRVGYAIDAPVVDYNPSTIAGSTGGSAAAFARTLLGFSYLDGLGNRVADTEFGNVRVELGRPSKLQLTINDNARFSDRTPISCDDILFSWLARRPTKGNPFRSMSMPGLSQIATINCAPGTKHAEVIFQSDRIPRDWLALFGAGTIMPWHIVSQATSVTDLRALISGKDPVGLNKVAAFWHSAWRLDNKGANLRNFLSSGPYVIEHLDEDGTIQLGRNPEWWGEKAYIARVVIYPSSVDIQKHVEQGHIQVGDIAADKTVMTVPNGFVTALVPSENVVQLRLSTEGVFKSLDYRRAFLSCINRQEIHEQLFPAKKQQTGAGTPEVLGREAASIVPLSNDPISRQVLQWVQNRPYRLKTPPKKPIKVNVAYRSSYERGANAIALMAQSCRSAGFDVIGKPLDSYTGDVLAGEGIQAGFFGTAGAVGPGGAFDPASGLLGFSPFLTPDFRNGNDRELYSRALQVDMVQGEHLPIHKDGIDMNSVFAHTIASLQQYLWDQGYAIPLYVQPRFQFTAEGLKGITQGRSAASVGWNMDRWSTK